MFTYIAPVAGAIAYAHTTCPIRVDDLVERIRTEQSVLLVPGEMFGVEKGIRFGFGYDIEHTLKGLARVDETLARWPPARDHPLRVGAARRSRVPPLPRRGMGRARPRRRRTCSRCSSLEGAQAGLSWSTILHKREGYRRAFAGFDPAKVARFTPAKVERLLQDPRHRPQPAEGGVDRRERASGARRCSATSARSTPTSGRSSAAAETEPLAHRADVPAETDESRAMSKDLKRRGFRFVDPTVCYAFMQATGMVNDHVARLLPLGGATRRDLIQRLAQPFNRIAPELRESIEEQDPVVGEGCSMSLEREPEGSRGLERVSPVHG